VCLSWFAERLDDVGVSSRSSSAPQASRSRTGCNLSQTVSRFTIHVLVGIYALIYIATHSSATVLMVVNTRHHFMRLVLPVPHLHRVLGLEPPKCTYPCRNCLLYRSRSIATIALHLIVNCSRSCQITCQLATAAFLKFLLPRLSSEHLLIHSAYNYTMPSFISSILWVPRGVSARHPRTYDLADPGELERVERLGKIKLDDARKELEALEAQVDGMDIEDGDDDNKGDEDSGDDWADEDEEEDEDADENENESEDPAVKARQAKERILGAQAAAMQAGSTDKKDDMSKYNLDAYDDEVKASASELHLYCKPASSIIHPEFYADISIYCVHVQVWASLVISKD
jgi:hypothetical protein